MDLWTNMNLEWDCGLDQPSGLFGDLEELGHLYGDTNPALKARDAVKQSVSSPEPQETMDLDWMESGDLSSFLEALNKGQEIQLPLENGLLDCSQMLDVKDEPVSQEDFQQFSSYPEVEFVDLGLTPPESPEQVTPVIQFDTGLSNDQVFVTSTVNNLTPAVQEISVTPPSPATDFQVDYLLDPVDTIFGLHLSPDSELVNTVGIQEDITLNYSSGITSLPSTPTPSISPVPSPKPSIDILIQSSPELYKVIATPSSVAARFSPYSKSKDDQKAKVSTKSSRSKAAHNKQQTEAVSELVSEELFCGQLGKRERKKLQNKNAAIRYRQKKKAEVEGITSEVSGLEDRNTELKGKVDDLQREIKYMKNLMDEIYRAKGLIK